MGEEFIGKGEFEAFKLSIYCGRPPEYEMYDRDICSIHVKYEHEEGIIFIDQTHIAHIAEKDLQKQIEKFILKYKDLRSLLVQYTVKKAKDRINSGNFKKGKTYLEEVFSHNLGSWVKKVESLLK